MQNYDADNAASELARAARLERMANELMLEAREIRAKYAKPNINKPRRSMAEIVKEINSKVQSNRNQLVTQQDRSTMKRKSKNPCADSQQRPGRRDRG